MEWLWLSLALIITFLLGFVVALYMVRRALAKASDFWEKSVKLKDEAVQLESNSQAVLAQAESLFQKAQELDNRTMKRLEGNNGHTP